MRRRSRWPEFLVIAGLCFLTGMLLVANWTGLGSQDDPLGETRTPSRVFEGVVVADGQPLAGVELELREEREPVATAVSDAQGRYSILWTPRTTLDADKLLLRALHPKHAKTISAPSAEFEMLDRVQVDGVVLGADGRPWPGVRVEVASQGEPYGSSESAEDGTISFQSLPREAELELFAEGAGIAPKVFRGFQAADRLVLHVEKGKAVEVAVRSPSGEPVEGARLSVAVPEEFSPRQYEGELARIVATSSSSGFIAARAPGYLPVFVDAPIRGEVEAVLWPARDVTLRVYDAVRKRGVLGVEVEVMLGAGGANQLWNGRDAERTLREFPLRMGERRGQYTIRLPRIALRLRVTVDGFGDAEVKLNAKSTVANVRLHALRSAPRATLRVRTAASKGPIWLVVADPEGGWFAAFQAPGEVSVPAGRSLELASAGASDGLWLPPIPVEPIGRGRLREVNAPLRPAAELIVQTQPNTPCEIELVDAKFGKAVPPTRRSSTGRASFWVRPRREVKVTVRPRGNWREVSADLSVELNRREWNVYLESAAGLHATVRDPKGHPVPFADVRYWEAGRAGRMELRLLPEQVRTDALGVLDLLGLRGGPTPLEIAADGFRTARPRIAELRDGTIVDGGVIQLEPAGVVRGRVFDPGGRPLPGVVLRTISRGVGRLDLPQGGERDLYDLTDELEGEAISDDEGRFEVEDSTPRLPMLVAEAPSGRDLAVFATFVEGAMEFRMPRAAHVELPVRGSVEGVYLLLPGARAVRVHSPGPLRLNPIPLTLPAGKVELFVRYRSGRWSAGGFNLTPGYQRIEMPR